MAGGLLDALRRVAVTVLALVLVCTVTVLVRTGTRTATTAATPTPTPTPSRGPTPTLSAEPVVEQVVEPVTEPAMDPVLDVTELPASAALAVAPSARGTGRLVVVPGSEPAPGGGRVYRVRVEVEQGVAVNPAAFADLVLATLNDRRSWGHGGTKTFARTSGAADIRVVLASPVTSARLCAPLVTHGTLSCGSGDHAILTSYRWANGTTDYGSDLTGYRRYLVNHEVGHVLGHGHQTCPGRGRLAPVMMQQTKGLNGCARNSWPNP